MLRARGQRRARRARRLRRRLSQHRAPASASGACRGGRSLRHGAGAPIEDTEIDAPYETPEAAHDDRADRRRCSCLPRCRRQPHRAPRPCIEARRSTRSRAGAHRSATSPPSVELGLTLPADAGAVAEERGAPGGDLAASDWTPTPMPRATARPAWLTGRFGETETVRLIVDGKRTLRARRAGLCQHLRRRSAARDRRHRRAEPRRRAGRHRR